MDFSLALSFVALVATFYQAHLQRVHNQKSVKPLPQIDLMDREGVMYIHIVNNGVGPMIVDKLTFKKGDQGFDRIQDCINLDPKSYYHVDVSATNKKVIIPGGFLVVFAETLDPSKDQETIGLFRLQLSLLYISVDGQDIYNNEITLSKSLAWFGRHYQVK